jgi:glucose 1-dehydrogenase
MVQGLEGKRVLVTGATSGIGQAIAVRFASYGAHVAINYRADPAEAAETHDQVDACLDRIRGHGVHHALVRADVSDAEQVAHMFGDVLVNNAGIQLSSPSEDLAIDDFDRVLAVNLRGAFLCAREAVRRMLEQDASGSIINISSVHQRIPKPDYLGYSVSKGGMANLTTTLALEFAERNIRVNAVGPGATITPINAAWADDPDKAEQVNRHIPLGRAGTADEMAGVVCFLASDDAAYITGQTLYVDGGLTLYPDFRTPWSSE